MISDWQALIRGLCTHWSGGWSGTDHLTAHAVITWLVVHWSRVYHTVITWLRGADHVKMERTGKEESILKQTILKANAFIDLNKLFNLFHFLKLENWSRNVSTSEESLNGQLYLAHFHPHCNLIQSLLCGLWRIYFLFLFLRSLNKLGGPPADHTAAGSGSEPHL